MKHLLLPALFAVSSCAFADANSAAQKLGGSFDASTGNVVVKINKAPDVTAIAELASDPKVKSLNLDGCSLKSDGVAAIATSKSVTALLLEHTMVNKVPDLKELAKVQTLEEISLGGSNFGDDGLAVLCSLKNLKSLLLGHVGRDDRNFFTAEGLKTLQGLPKLETLVLHLHKPTDDMLPVFAQLKTVKEFKVSGINAAFLASLQKAMPQAKVLPRGKLVD